MEKFLIFFIAFTALTIGINSQQLAFAGTLICGDGILGTPDQEQCDDGNTISGDGCSATCMIELPENGQSIGGEIISLDKTSLLVAGAQTNYSIITALAVLGSVFGALFYSAKKK